jgi:hypothetical protein
MVSTTSDPEYTTVKFRIRKGKSESEERSKNRKTFWEKN